MGKGGWFSRLFGGKVSPEDREGEHLERKKQLLGDLKDAALEGDGKKMLRCASKLVDLEPFDPEYWKLKANALRYLGRTAEAEECDRRADELRKMKS